jgi:hemerythrin
MNNKSINKAIKKVKAEKKVSQKDKDFLVAWLKQGLDGPDQLLKEEIALNG